jgi:arginase
MSTPAPTPKTFINSSPQTSLLGIPLDLGAENLGVDIGPNAFRHQKIVAKLTGAGLAVTDTGDIPVPARATLQVGNPRLRYLDPIIEVSNAAAARTEPLIRDGQRVIALGGDHSIAMGVVAGASAALDGDLGLIYLDAHGDLNTHETTPSGNIHGMPLAAILGFGAPELTGIHTADRPKIAKTNLLHIGGIDFDQAELDLIEREHLTAFTIQDLLTHNLAPLLKHIDDLASRVGHLWVSLDLDCIDSTYAPGAGMPNPAGLSYREIATIATYIGSRASAHGANVVGVDIVEYNPLQDIDHKTAELGIELIAKLFGHNYSWYTNYLAKNQVG